MENAIPLHRGAPGCRKLTGYRCCHCGADKLHKLNQLRVGEAGVVVYQCPECGTHQKAVKTRGRLRGRGFATRVPPHVRPPGG